MINDSRAAARQLNAKNPVTFECVHDLGTCQEKLGAIFHGGVSPAGVDLAWKYARFLGHWTNDAGGTKLTGHVERSRRTMIGLNLFLLPVALFIVIGLKAAAGASWEGPALFFLILPTLVAFVGTPLVAIGLGSARVASEIELVRAIGQAIGDPQAYAVRWRRLDES